MCGIVGYIGSQEATPIIFEGLRRLEYRGYDSAGIALVDDAGALFVEKRAGKLANLQTALVDRQLLAAGVDGLTQPLDGQIGHFLADRLQAVTDVIELSGHGRQFGSQP